MAGIDPTKWLGTVFHAGHEVAGVWRRGLERYDVRLKRWPYGARAEAMAVGRGARRVMRTGRGALANALDAVGGASGAHGCAGRCTWLRERRCWWSERAHGGANAAAGCAKGTADGAKATHGGADAAHGQAEGRLGGAGLLHGRAGHAHGRTMAGWGLAGLLAVWA